MQQEFAALNAPVTDLTWEVTEDLPAATLETGRLPLDFRGAVEILGFYPSVIPTTATVGLRIPTLDDILVLIDVNQQERLTNRLEQGGNASQGVSYVTLGAIGVQVPRLFRKVLRQAKPEVGIQFRWKRQDAAFYQNARISLAFYVRYLDGEMASR
jgi:hypothetical protein